MQFRKWINAFLIWFFLGCTACHQHCWFASLTGCLPITVFVSSRAHVQARTTTHMFMTSFMRPAAASTVAAIVFWLHLMLKIFRSAYTHSTALSNWIFGLVAKTRRKKSSSCTFDEWLWKIQTAFFYFCFTPIVWWMFSEIEKGQNV